MFLATNTKYKIHNFLRSLAFLLFLQFVLLQQPITAQNSTGLENLPDEISFCLADFKFDGSMIKICEFGACVVSGFKGYTTLFGRGIIFPTFLDTLKSFNLPIWFVKPINLPRSSAKNNSLIDIKYVKKLSDIEDDPVFQTSQEKYTNKK